MKKLILFVLPATLLFSCTEKTKDKKAEPASIPVAGTWKLFSATTITGKDTVTTDYTTGKSEMVKIINDSYFAFFRHDLSKGKDSATKDFGSGAGRYTINGNQYTEHLDFCDARDWEGHTFQFTVTISNDTLVQNGLEKLENLGIDRQIIERYVRIKN